MIGILQNPSLLPSCILAGVATIMLVLAFTLPPLHVFTLIGGSTVTVGLVLARLRRSASRDKPVLGFGVEV